MWTAFDESGKQYISIMVKLWPEEKGYNREELVEKLQHLINQSKIITAQGIINFLKQKGALKD